MQQFKKKNLVPKFWGQQVSQGQPYVNPMERKNKKINLGPTGYFNNNNNQKKKKWGQQVTSKNKKSLILFMFNWYKEQRETL